MPYRTRWPQRIALVVALLACASAPTHTQARSFIWKVQSPTGLLYLAGSVHALGQDAYPLSSAFEQAFNASGTLVEEIDLAEADGMAALPMLMAKGMYRNGRTFEQAVSRETATLVKAKLQAFPGMLDMLQPMKPWVVALMLTAMQVQSAGLDPKLGLDKHFYDRAQAAGKAIVGLETAESQIDRFDTMPEAVQEQMLLSALKDGAGGDRELKTIIAAWKRGDATAIESNLLGGFKSLPAAYQSLIVERNRNWMPEIEGCLLKPRPCLVVVGAAHLVGSDGLLAMLAARGYRIEQL